MMGFVRIFGRANRRSVKALLVPCAAAAAVTLVAGIPAAASDPSTPANVTYSLTAALPTAKSSPPVNAAAPYTPAVLSLIAQLEPSATATPAQLANADAVLHDLANSTCHNVGPVGFPVGPDASGNPTFTTLTANLTTLLSQTDATHIVVASANGLTTAGETIYIDAGSAAEAVSVVSASGTTITLQAPGLTSTHAAGVAVTDDPAASGAGAKFGAVKVASVANLTPGQKIFVGQTNETEQVTIEALGAGANANVLSLSAPLANVHVTNSPIYVSLTSPSITPICWTDAQGVLNTSGNNARGSTAPTTLMSVGATFDRALGNAWGQTEGSESRAFMVTGMFGPQTDLDRLPNWGRNLTTTGEDPFLSNQLVASQINGMQGSGAMSEMKHFVVYNGQNQNLNTDIQDQGLHELYLTPYEGGFIDGNAAATMCSYQLWRDTSTSLPSAVSAVTQLSPFSIGLDPVTWPLTESHFSCEQPLSLNYVLRGLWGSKAFVGSDYPATHSTSGMLQGEDQEMPTQTGFFSSTVNAQGSDPTGSTCADTSGNAIACSVPGALHVGGIPNGFQGSSGTGCPTSSTGSPPAVTGGGCALVQAVATGNLPISVFNQSLARVLYQEQRFGLLGCNPTPTPACTNPGGVAGDRSGTAQLPAGSTGTLGTKVGDAAIVERMSEEGATLLKNDGNTLPITSSDLAGGVFVTGSSANHLVADPTNEASTGFIGRDAINPLQQLKGFSGNPSAFTFVPATDPDGITVPTSQLSTTADSSGLGGLNLSVDGGASTQDTNAIDHGAVNSNQLAAGHTYSWSGYLYVPTADTYTFAFQQSPTLPTTLNCPQTGQFNTPASDPTLTTCSAFTAANASQTNALPDAVAITLDGVNLNLNATTGNVFGATVPSNPTNAGYLDQGLISRTCATGAAALEPGTANCGATQSALTAGFHPIQITVNNSTNCVSTPAAAAAGANPAVAAVPAACTPASFRFAYNRTSGDISDAAAAAVGKKLALVFVNDGTGATSSTPNPGLAGTTISAPTELSTASENLINAVAAANPNTVVVLNTTNPVLVPWLPNVKAVLESWFAGQEGGTAMARVLLGLANPSGHTALTWPAKATDTIWGYNETTPLYTSDTTGTHPERLNGNGGCAVVAGSGATCPAASQTTESEGIFTGYRFFDKEGITPQFPFGYGLSYTSFGYSDLKVKGAGDGGADVSFRITNTGSLAGADAAQVYVGPPSDVPTGIQFAVRSLAQFERVSLQPGKSQFVTLHVPPRQLSYWSEATQKWVLDPAGRTFWVGDADSPASLPQHATLNVPSRGAGKSDGGHNNTSGSVTCSNEYFNATTIDGDLTVPDGAWCDLVDVTVNGDVQLHHSTGVRISGVTVNGDLQSDNAAGAADPLSSDANVVCASTISGNVQVRNSNSNVPWNIGGCGANTIGGNLQFQNNRADGNTVSNNTITGDLTCARNGDTASTGNVVHGKISGCTGTAAPSCSPVSNLVGTSKLQSGLDDNDAGLAEAFRADATNTGTANALCVYVDTKSKATTLNAGIYANNGGHPGALLASGSLLFPVDGGFNRITIPSVALDAGTTYWVAVLSPAGSGTLAIRDRCCGAQRAGDSPSETSASTTLTSLPATWAPGKVWPLDGPITAFGGHG